MCFRQKFDGAASRKKSGWMSNIPLRTPKNLLLPRLLSVSTSLTFLVMAYVSSSGDMATISWMLRPEWPGTGSGAASWDSPPEGSSDSDLMAAADDWEASGSPASPLTDSSAELRGDSGAGLQLADVFGVPSA